MFINWMIQYDNLTMKVKQFNNNGKMFNMQIFINWIIQYDNLITI